MSSRYRCGGLGLFEDSSSQAIVNVFEVAPKAGSSLLRAFQSNPKSGGSGIQDLAAGDGLYTPEFSCFPTQEGYWRSAGREGITSELQVKGPAFQPICILERRQVKQGKDLVQQVLVEWQEGGQECATWEDQSTMADQYPEFNLGDKVAKEGGNVRSWEVYVRRNKKGCLTVWGS
ncbi:hypothetical protein V8G54_037925 (chloroplast) [Vigna mungo]|uniref:Chromo domain-containing protein n=1 Tax=Vigna mungo TaxID=3915 RepID=A0AAQ3MDA7_VIGMU